ncbi:hypothetical protein, partial [Bartonella apihabitans]|uniref:hypothetical protein n=1 Tax=Bartonella apihabitans TaxID=2750929 RepID=UPI003BB77ACF
QMSCNRLENAVKPQRLPPLIGNTECCNRLENAVKPQHGAAAQQFCQRCNRLKMRSSRNTSRALNTSKLVVTD